MMRVSFENTLKKIPFEDYAEKVKAIHRNIEQKLGEGSDFLGWKDWPETYDRDEVSRILKSAQYVREHFDILVVCGIGGSYLGARAAIEALNGLYSNDKMEILYFGQTFSPNYIAQVMEYLKGKRFAINVISKSGTTTETSIAFRMVKELLEKQLGKEKAKRAIFATTDKARGALKTLADAEGYETFVLPDDIGGRYSVLTAVGLFPMAVAGIDIQSLLNGALEAMKLYQTDDLSKNPCYQYAVARDYFYRHGKSVDLFVSYEPSLTQLGEWFKQLFGESEGKNRQGLFPVSVTFSTDLHSLGQYVQDGTPLLFETILYVKRPRYDVAVPHSEDNLDGLNYLESKSLAYINEKAFLGTLDAHVREGKVPCLILEADQMDAKQLGHLFYFFMRACAMSAYLLGINPFNQPGVEVYKRNMFHLLGKKGY